MPMIEAELWTECEFSTNDTVEIGLFDWSLFTYRLPNSKPCNTRLGHLWLDNVITVLDDAYEFDFSVAVRF